MAHRAQSSVGLLSFFGEAKALGSFAISRPRALLRYCDEKDGSKPIILKNIPMAPMAVGRNPHRDLEWQPMRTPELLVQRLEFVDQRADFVWLWI
jgi:hypothetical protein